VTIKLFTDNGSNSNGHGHDITDVTVLVEDTGIGMSRDFVSNDAFVPFRQADAHSTGTGLGLSIVKEVVKEFKGSLKIHSELGKGSSVSVKFAANFTEPSEASDDDLVGLSGARIRQLHVLHLAEHLGHPRSRSITSVAGSLQRIASQWLECEVSSSREITPGPRGSVCAISETEIGMLNMQRSDGVRSLIETLAESDSRLLIFAPSMASSQPMFEFKSFKHKPIYVHQP
jgi:hypothetical protein